MTFNVCRESWLHVRVLLDLWNTSYFLVNLQVINRGEQFQNANSQFEGN